MKPDPRCLGCNGRGYFELPPDQGGGWRACACTTEPPKLVAGGGAGKAEPEPLVQVTGGVSSGRTRRTLQGMADAIVEQIQRVAYAGEVKPHVFLYARPGALPSVKVTVELHVIENATVITEIEKDGI